jgi:hypothetical protein
MPRSMLCRRSNALRVAANIALLGLNMRDGLKMKGWLRSRPA